MNTLSAKPEVALLVGTCDTYDDTWAPFFHQLKKHWNSFAYPIYLATERTEFHYDGLNIINKPRPCKEIWSKRILQTLNQIDSEFILFMLDDFWLTSDVNVDDFNEIINIMRGGVNIGYINLYADKTDNGRWLSLNGTTRGIKESEYDLCWETTRECPYRITTSAGLWRKSFLCQILRSHENAWQFEGRANWRVNRYYKNIKILETKKRLLEYPNGGFIWGGKCKEKYVNLFPPELTADCISKRGFYDETAKYSVPIVHKNLKTYWGKILSILPFKL